MTPQQERFEGLLPFYVNGTLQPDDLVFMQDYLARHANAGEAFVLTQHIQRTVQSMMREQPQTSTVERFLDKWVQTQTATSRKPVESPSPIVDKLSGWWIGLAGLGVAAIAATVVLIPGFTSIGVLHLDGLDGAPDLELVLARSITPDHESIAAHLKQFNGQIVAQSEQDGFHRVSIDLQNRASDQHALIEALQSAGHLQSYTVLASR